MQPLARRLRCGCCAGGGAREPSEGSKQFRKKVALASLDAVCCLGGLLAGVLLQDAGGRIVGIPSCLLYTILGLLAVVLAGGSSLAVGTWLIRAERDAAAASQGLSELGSPLLRVQHAAARGVADPGSADSPLEVLETPAADGGLGLGSQSTETPSTQPPSSPSSSDVAGAGSLALLDLPAAKRLAQIDHAVAVRRRVIFIAAYVTVTVLSFGLGIAAVDLREGGGPIPEGPEVGLVAMAIFSLQAAFFFTKWLVVELLAMPATTLELRAVHLHSLHFDVNVEGHSCDICGEDIDGGESFRCKLCDFDYCFQCFKKGKKLQDWGLLRGDKGVKVPERVRQASMTSFFFRSILLLRPYKMQVFGTACCLLFNVVCRLLVPNLEGGIFDDLINKDSDSFLWRTKLLILYWVGQTVFQSAQRFAARLISRQLRLDLRTKLFERLLVQDIAFFDATRAGAMASRVEGDVEDMSRPVPLIINRVLQSVVLIVGALTCCLVASPRLTVLSAACIGPVGYLTRVSAEWFSNLNNQMCACDEEGNSVVTEALTNIRHVRAFSAEAYESQRYRKVLTRLFRKMYKEALGDMMVENLEGSLNFLVEMLVLLFGGLAIVEGHSHAISIGQLIAFTMYWDILRDGLDSVQDMFSDLAQAAGAAQRVFDLMDISPDIPVAAGHEFQRDSFRGHIVFEDVRFTYQARPEKPVLRGLDLDIPARGSCALVGRSGAGKSTLMHLLLRFYDPQQGRIVVDGTPLTELNLKTLHDLTGFVSQDTKLTYGSIRDNMTYGLPGGPPTDEALQEAARAANCLEFIEETEEGYDSKVGEGGVRLSGGQRQRLAIARALLRKPRLLILDEATSHLDAENELMVQAAIDSLVRSSKEGDPAGSGGGCTVILIAHRLSTVRDADVIAVLNDGCIVEKGCHEDLVSLDGGIYAQLVAKQAERAANVLPEAGASGSEAADGDAASTAQQLRSADMDQLFDKVLGRKEPSSGGGSKSGSGSSSGDSESGSEGGSGSGSS